MKAQNQAYFNNEKLKFYNSIPDIEKEYNIKILLAFVRGSYMYGTNTDKSDVDITFIYKQSTNDILKGNYIEQLNIGGNDIVGYEIQRYIQLLSQNNPNILESLDIPDDCLIYKDESMDIFNQRDWVSKLTEKTILGYANSQIKKATGLNKNMNNPQPVTRKSILEFCYVIFGGSSQPLIRYANDMSINLDKVGVVKNQNGKGLYAFYTDNKGEYNFRGIIKNDDSTQIRLSAIPLDAAVEIDPIVFYYNQDGFETHIKSHTLYWKWVNERNEERFNMNQEAGQGVDCYLDSMTEYLTNKGWMKYDDITDDLLIGSISENRELIFTPILDRYKEKYNGVIYTYEDRYTKFSVTPNHKLWQSKLYRTSNDDSYKEYRSKWEFKTVEEYINQKGLSNYLSHLNNRKEGIKGIQDEWFFILGAYIGDGYITMRNNKPHCVHISQNENKHLYDKLRSISNSITFDKETKLGKNYRFNFSSINLRNWIYNIVGTGSLNKRFPLEYFNKMSDTQFELFFEGLIHSDGTTDKKSGNMVYYSINKNLIDDLQLFFISRGIYCQIYEYPVSKSKFNNSTETYFHLNIPKNNKKEYKQLLKKNFKKYTVDDYISCFTVNNGILLTRNSNKIAIQGNTKNMMHLFRLLEMASKIGKGKGLQVRSHKVEVLMDIRKGKYNYKDLLEQAETTTNHIKELFLNVDLIEHPDTEFAKELLLKFRNS